MRSSFHKPKIKEYDTVVIACQYLDDAKAPISLEGIEIKAEMRGSSGELVGTLIVVDDDIENGKFTLKPALNKLPTGPVSIDVLFSKDGSRMSSQTFTMTVYPAVTKP
jgi:hypothetical protein